MNLLTFAIGIAAIFLLARYNNSNKLFWKLLIAMMCGFVCGSISARMASKSEKKVEVSQKALTQASSIDYALFNTTPRLKDTQVEPTTKLVSQCFFVRDRKPIYDPYTEIYESDVGELNKFPNTS